MTKSKATDREIHLIDVAWQHAMVRDRIDAKLDALFSDPVCDGGAFVKELEAHFRSIIGVTNAVAVHSGLAGEFLILKALGIGPGDEVITAPNSDLATTSAISHTGARFKLVDIETDSFNIDPDLIEAAITERTRAIVPVHMYGLPANTQRILEIAGRHSIPVVEDATLALGATIADVPAGASARAAFFSFAPRKVVGGTGNGGMVVTNDDSLARRIREDRAYGLDPDEGELPVAQRGSAVGFRHIVEGYNVKLDGMQAAIIFEKLQHLEGWRVRRQAIADRYSSLFTKFDEIVTPVVPADVNHAWRNYVVQLPERDMVRQLLAEHNIPTAVLYIPPVHLQPVYAEYGFGPGDFPVAEAVANRLLALPMHPGLSDDDVDYVADRVVSALLRALA